jgi:acyl-CoA thioester hydrolase
MNAPYPARHDFLHHQRVTTRWTDNDRYGHVNNAIYYQYFDSVINAYLIAEGQLDIHGGSVVGFIVRSECDFLAPVTYPGEVDIGVAVVRLGNSSVTYETGLFKPDESRPCAVGRMVHVFVDTGTQRPVALPASIRSALVRLLRTTPPHSTRSPVK